MIRIVEVSVTCFTVRGGAERVLLLGVDQEALCSFLGHLHIEGTLPPPLLVKLSVLLQHIQTVCRFEALVFISLIVAHVCA
jgi:hypothetical protein